MKTFASALANRSFTVTAELPMAAPASLDDALQQSRSLAPWVDAVQLTPNPEHPGQVSPVALAALLLREGIDPLVRLTCRDSNRLALQGDLIGLKALGVSSLLLNRGNRLQIPGTQTGEPVFDINCRQLIAMAADISEEGPGGPGQEFIIGTSATVASPGPGWKAKMLTTRGRSGARLLLTQPCFSVPILKRFMQRLVALRLTWNFAVVVTLAPLPGAEFARWQLENARNAVVPKTLARALSEAKDPRQAGINHCARLMREIAAIPGISGVNLMTLGDTEATIAAIEYSGLREGAAVQ